MRIESEQTERVEVRRAIAACRSLGVSRIPQPIRPTTAADPRIRIRKPR